MDADAKHIEMDPAMQARALCLLFETGTPPMAASATLFLAAYQAVLTKDLLWATNELLEWKRAERFT